MLYLDTSALLKLYLREEGSEWVQTQVTAQSAPLPVWELQEAELTNALRLKVFWRDITATQAQAQLAHFRSRKDRAALMERFRLLAHHSMKLGTRTLDVMHVACACEIQADHFLSFDERQLSLAKLAGLRVLTPKMP